jgi:hypothetical protein
MREKFDQLAATAAYGASRREFLGRLGRGAMLAAAAAGGLLAAARPAHAGRCPPGTRPCWDKFVGRDCCPKRKAPPR